MERETESTKLEYINENEAKTLLPVLVFYIIIMVISIAENISVIVVYRLCFKESPRKIYILYLSIVDLALCCIGIPYHVLDLRNPYTYKFSATCKILSLFLSSTFLCSGLTLLVVGVDRYFKICRPFKSQMTTRGAKCICATLMCVSIVIASPQVILYGYSSIDIANENVTGVQCFFEDHYVGSTLPIIYHGLIMTIFVTTTIILIVLYFKICKTLYMHKRRLSRLRLNKKIRRTQNEQGNTSSQLVNDENNDVEIIVMLMDYGKENVTNSQRSNAEFEVLGNKHTNVNTSHYETKLPNSVEKHSIALIDIPFEEQTRKSIAEMENNQMISEVHRVNNDPELKQTYMKQNTAEIQSKDDFESNQKDNPKHKDNHAYYNARKVDSELYKVTADRIEVYSENTPRPEEIIFKTGNSENTNSMEFHSNFSRDNGINSGETVDNFLNCFHRTARTIIKSCFCFNIFPDKDGEQNQMCLSKDKFIRKILGNKRALKITYMTFTITVVFIVSYFPSIYIMMISLLDMDYWVNLSTQQTVLYELLMRSYLINSMVNPIIYGFWDERFRFECWKMVKCFKSRVV